MTAEHAARVSLLFNRLLWPSAIVRDRACTAIANLLVDPRIGPDTLSRYFQWISELKLESWTANALLPIILATESGKDFDLPDQDDVESYLSHPSLLSVVLVNELWQTQSLPNYSELHSGTSPADFTRGDFFEKYAEAFLPPIYRSLFVEEIKRQFSFDLSKQWAFEWEQLIERTGKVPSERPLQYWLGTRDTEPRHLCMDTEMSEIYRSAFLRALAWAVDSDLMPARAAFEQTGMICPIDIDLFKIQPKSKPIWWPQASSSKSKIDISASGIWEQVDKLWESHTTNEDFIENLSSGDEHLLASASGLVGDEETKYDIEIQSAFQKSGGSQIPDAESVFRFLQQNPESISLRAKSSVRFSGIYKQNQLNHVIQPIEDWSFVAATSAMFIQPRWQFWRMRRTVRIPSPVYSLSDLDVNQDETGIVTKDSTGQIISRWSDWTHGLSEKRVAELPDSTGEMLTIKRDVIERFAGETSSNFCWVVRLTGFTREGTYREYQSFAEFRIYGASAIIQS